MSMLIDAYRAAGGGSGDPYWSSVASLLHFNGASGSTTFTDQTGKIWTPSGATIDTSVSVFGGASGLFPGSANISTPNHADFDFGSGEFTIEGWTRFSTLSSAYNGVICHDDIGVTRGWVLTKELPGFSTPHAVTFAASVGGTAYTVNSAATPTVGVWDYHAIVRDGSTLRYYYNGAQSMSAAIAGSINNPTIPAYMGTLVFSSVPSPVNSMQGNLDEWRVTKGVCRYPGGATFTVPSMPFPNF